MRRFAVAMVLSLCTLAVGAQVFASRAVGKPTIEQYGVTLDAPQSWSSVEHGDAGIVDPTTVLVVGSPGVKPLLNGGCQVADYRVPPEGAVVVVLRWRTITSGGGRPPVGRAPLKTLTHLTRRNIECFAGRGAAAQLALGDHAYQVNIMVGDRATPGTIHRALAAARSFRLSAKRGG
jgi:hypothetical protein